MQIGNLKQQRGSAKMLFGAGGAVLCLAVILGGSWFWHKSQRAELALRVSDQYFSALDGKESQKTFLSLSKSPLKQVAAYAAVREADIARKAKLDAQAKSSLMSENITEEPLKGLASFMALNLKASHLENVQSDMDLRELRQGYEKLAQSSPQWGDFAREGLVSLDLRKGASQEDKAEAVRLLKEIISSPQALPGMRQRSAVLLQALES